MYVRCFAALCMTNIYHYFGTSLLYSSSPARLTRRSAHKRACPGASSSQPAKSTAYYEVEKGHAHQKIPEMQTEQF